jgi:ATP-dependent exoDNAse (exonuclease V) beta subunit
MQTGNYFDEKTKKCAEVINEFTKGMKTAREIVIYENLEISGENVLVQGVIDLLAINRDRAIIIDYKTTKADPKKLIELYKPQLEMYMQSVARATGLETEVYIYSTAHSKLIKL